MNPIRRCRTDPPLRSGLVTRHDLGLDVACCPERREGISGTAVRCLLDWASFKKRKYVLRGGEGACATLVGVTRDICETEIGVRRRRRDEVLFFQVVSGDSKDQYSYPFRGSHQWITHVNNN